MKKLQATKAQFSIRRVFKFSRLVKLGGFLILVVTTALALNKSEIFRQIAENQRLINDVYKYLITNYVDDININEFTRASIRNMVGEMDPYTVYMEKDEQEGIRMLTDGKYGGVGIQIGKRDGKLTVIASMDDSPAKRAGIISGDVIVRIDSLSTHEMTLNDASDIIRGPRGTTVILTVERFGEDTPLEFELVRDNIEIHDVAYYDLLSNGSGYIRLTRFSRHAGDETKAAVQDLLSQGATSFILDLRDNPGGLLSSALDILEIFVPRGEILLKTRGRTREANRVFKAHRPAIADEEIPLAILINGGSASASEIVAGAIQDLDRGVIIGRSSFGKGLVQSVYQLDEDRSLKITTAKYYIPSGRLIQKPGYIDEDVVDGSDIEDSLFTTKSGRQVTGGGGIIPDYVMEQPDKTVLTRECWRKGLFFSFVQQDRYQYDSMDQVISDPELMDRFRDYLDTTPTDLTLTGELEFEKARKKFMTLDSTNTELQDAINTIEAFFSLEEYELFDQEAEELQRSLLMEYANTLEGSDGRFRVSIQNDEVIEKAQDVLEDQQIYREIFTVNE